MYGHVITKFSRMGRFTYPWCSAGALRALELRYKFVQRHPTLFANKVSVGGQLMNLVLAYRDKI